MSPGPSEVSKHISTHATWIQGPASQPQRSSLQDSNTEIVKDGIQEISYHLNQRAHSQENRLITAPLYNRKQLYASCGLCWNAQWSHSYHNKLTARKDRQGQCRQQLKNNEKHASLRQSWNVLVWSSVLYILLAITCLIIHCKLFLYSIQKPQVAQISIWNLFFSPYSRANALRDPNFYALFSTEHKDRFV